MRPQLDAVHDAARTGDTLVVWRLERLGRCLRHLIDVVNDLNARGVGLRSLQEVTDTTTPGDRLVFHVFGAVAQFERHLIIDRMQAGLAAAEESRRMYEAKKRTVDQISHTLSCSRCTLHVGVPE